MSKLGKWVLAIISTLCLGSEYPALTVESVRGHLQGLENSRVALLLKIMKKPGDKNLEKTYLIIIKSIEEGEKILSDKVKGK